jgi:hypothetical protein
VTSSATSTTTAPASAHGEKPSGRAVVVIGPGSPFREGASPGPAR